MFQVRERESYRLNPNDDLIFATCKYYQISYLVSLDGDFEEPCKGEEINLINTPERLKKILTH